MIWTLVIIAIFSSMADVCIICNEGGEQPTSTLREKGCQSINDASKKKGDSILAEPGQQVHQECRKKYCHPRQLKLAESITPESILSSPKTRQQASDKYNVPVFSFRSNCILCGTEAKYATKKRGLDVYPVRTLEFQQTIYAICNSRNDEWAEEVKGRLEYAQDLPAVEARYHQQCSANFRTGCRIPYRLTGEAPSCVQKLGRPTKSDVEKAFLETLSYFETNADKQVTISDLVEKMGTMCGNNAYSVTYMKKKVNEYFGNSIVISEMNGKHNVITFRSAADSILHSFHNRNTKESSDSEKEAIIKTAAKFILNDIKSLELSKKEYPSADNIMSVESNREFVPECLVSFLNVLFTQANSDKKVLSIGQAIVQNAVPRKIVTPLQIGLGVQMHHHFGSKFLIETLNSLGFCSSYSEVQKFETSAALTQDVKTETSDNTFIQYVADNVDHNLRTLDGHNTFHGMGIIATFTPKLNVSRRIPRIQATNEDLATIGKININYYKQPLKSAEKMMFKKLVDMQNYEDSTIHCDYLIRVARLLNLKVPMWSGFMQMVQTGNHPGMSSVVFLPMIDLNPSDMSCIYSTLRYITSQSVHLNAKPIVTFDQPLYWKALQIVNSEPENSEIKQVILRLGGFHAEMSFLGAIGRLMENSGLHELLETVYASNTVGHMLSGKAIARAVRGHFLVADALDTLLLERIYLNKPDATEDSNDIETMTDVPPQLPESDSLYSPDVTNLQTVVENVLTKEQNIHELKYNELLNTSKKTYETEKSNLKQHRTARLWIQYLEMIDMLKDFLKAERTGNWKLHIKTMQQMLPYFAAAGHNLYLKSCYMYLQQMTELCTKAPAVWNAFCEGYHVIRRSDRYWAGLSTDLVIEQVLMRSLKSVGGLTRGRGMSESQRAQWLLSMPACSDINNAMQTFAETYYETSDQHKECLEARKIRDEKDRNTLLEFLRDRNPFREGTELRNIETGALADKCVNVDNALEIGKKVLSNMEGNFVRDHSFKKSQQATTMNAKNVLNVDGEDINVDPQLLFQRLIMTSDDSIDNTEDIFKYELCTHPSSLFDSSGLLREAQKPALANALWAQGPCGVEEIPETNIKYVLDGGSLLQRIPWTFGATFGQICETYCRLVCAQYHKATVVFDGYTNGPTTKDVTHDRRTKGITGTNIIFDQNTPFKTKKDVFLSNKQNKQRFINLLGTFLQEKECTVIHAESDADVLIVQTAVQISTVYPTAVVGEDTDVLILLCYHAKLCKNKIYFFSDIKSSMTRTRKIWDITKTKQMIGEDQCSRLPFLHAFTGSDTTSRIYGIGKGTVLKKLMSDKSLQEHADIFLNDSSEEAVVIAGEEIFVSLFNGSHRQTLNNLRYQKFLTKVQTCNTFVQIKTLPPTQGAARFHSMRTYLQTQVWMGRELNPSHWGWCEQSPENKLLPIKTLLPVAPDRLLKSIRCTCKVSCCSKRCSCRKHGLSCGPGCSECKGISCSNAPRLTESDITDT